MTKTCSTSTIFSSGGQKSRLFFVLYLFFLGFGFPTGGYADESGVPEYQVKAAMLYKFLGYVEWPPSAFDDEREPYRIGVSGSSRLERELRRITRNRVVNDRPIEVFKVNSARRIDDPHMVFVGRKSEESLPLLAGLAERKCFLLVTEKDEEGLKEGGMINLRAVNERIVFDVSLVNARKCNFKLSARLLSVAASVEQEGN